MRSDPCLTGGQTKGFTKPSEGRVRIVKAFELLLSANTPNGPRVQKEQLSESVRIFKDFGKCQTLSFGKDEDFPY